MRQLFRYRGDQTTSKGMACISSVQAFQIQ
jgi:hypothetical protein